MPAMNAHVSVLYAGMLVVPMVPVLVLHGIELSPSLCCLTPTVRGDLHDFSQSVTNFLRCFLRTLPVVRIATLLALVLEAIRERKVGSVGALSSILAAFDLNGAKVPVMGHDILLQLNDTLLAVVPSLNQVLRQYCR